MKLFTLGSLLAVASCAQAFAAGAQDFIRQRNLDGLLTWDVPVNAVKDVGTYQGTFQSSQEIPKQGAVYTLHDGDKPATPLDTKVVGAYTPEANFTVRSKDPYPVLRTRADMPFGLSLEVKGLLPGVPDAPQAAKRVYFESFYAVADPATKLVDENNLQTSSTLVNDFFITNNTIPGQPLQMADPVSGKTDVFTQIPSTIPFRQMGKEYFRVWAEADQNLAFREIQQTAIQIWPVASISLKGITDNMKILKSMPEVKIDMLNLYPDSKTWLQIYKGAPQIGKSGTVLKDSDVTYYSPIPQDYFVTLPYGSLDNYVPDDGQYTLEVITTTPFNERKPERLLYVTFEVDRHVEVKGNVTTSEE